jgi:hypothetical protein
MLLDLGIRLLLHCTLQQHAQVVPRGTIVCLVPISDYIERIKPYLDRLTGNTWFSDALESLCPAFLHSVNG